MSTHKLVCAPALSTNVIEGSSFNHVCTMCGRHVAVAPSGQAKLATMKPGEIDIVCYECVRPQVGDTIEVAPGALQEARLFFRQQMECVACGSRRDRAAGGDPICNDCGMPMIVVKE